MVLSSLTDGISRSVGALAGSVTDLFEPTLRLGVTGLSGAGKTVFITALVANLLDRGRMPQLAAEAQGRIETVLLQPQPDLTLPRFDYEGHLSALLGSEPRWPQSTRAVSELRLSFRLRPSGLLGLAGSGRLHLDIVDYPGEWLLDLSLLDKDYPRWSAETLERIGKRPEAAAFLALARAEDGALALDEPRAQSLAAAFTDYLNAARGKGWSDLTPGRFLLPGDLAGSPVLTFAPLPEPASAPRGSLWREMERRFEAYKAKVVKPFFRDHFSRIDRQVVLMDVLGAIHAGPRAVEDLRRTMAEILTAFRPGANGWLNRILGGKRVEKILFAATKADHLHHHQHPALTAITEALLSDARRRADFSGARTAALSLASIRATVEDSVQRDGAPLDLVRGRLQGTGKQAAMYAGDLPTDPARILAPAREGAERWLDADFALMGFAPARMTLKPGEGPPHIRLDRAAEFLIGDRL
ncbi:YcjX family protein [Pseudotabrizicola algicola]|uniref:YcjX family protein n=1 Tax=Pseudotabrizicola algicola TaxID=2709381 RepID=A0A6B3RPX9_9RHOB|nr:YcjX family protein [Pseudotabrizicola algicola]NEX47541.1 YcjX family protein [Pseudotabrizicola algicola]